MPSSRSLIPQAAARHQCSYLVNLHVNDFLQVGGDPKWLNGLDEAPQKLQQLGELNKILAHRPWLLTKEHIEVRGWATGVDRSFGAVWLSARLCITSPETKRDIENEQEAGDFRVFKFPISCRRGSHGRSLLSLLSNS